MNFHHSCAKKLRDDNKFSVLNFFINVKHSVDFRFGNFERIFLVTILTQNVILLNFIVYQTLHFLSEFIFVFAGHLKSSENSFMLLNEPKTLN